MKKILKVLPSLLMIAFITACDSFKITVKEPSFASKGKNIDQDTFRHEITTAYLESEMFQEQLNLNSSFMVFNDTSIEKQNRAKNKKVYYTNEYTTQTEGYIRYDANNLLLEQVQNRKKLRTIESNQVTSKKTTKNEEKTLMERGEEEYEGQVISLDKKRYTISVVKTLADGESAKPTFDSVIASLFTTYFNSSRMMHFAESGDVHLYKFYKKSNLFTVTYKETYETTETGIVNDHSIDVKRYYVSHETKSQVDLTKGAEAVRISDKVDTTCEILQDHSNYKKGEIIDVVNIRYVVCTVSNQNVELKKDNNYDRYDGRIY